MAALARAAPSAPGYLGSKRAAGQAISYAAARLGVSCAGRAGGARYSSPASAGEPPRARAFAPAFLAVTGESDTAFAAEFAGAMRLRFGWAVLMTRWPGLFVLLAVAFLVGGARKLVLARRRLAAMEDPDFRRDEPPTSSH